MAKSRCMTVFTAIILLCMSAGFCQRLPESENNEREILLGINGMDFGRDIIDVLSYYPHNHSWTTYVANITDYSYSTWFIPSFFTAYCSVTRIFYVLLDDITQNKLIAVDVRERKVIGTMKFNGRLKYQHCDEGTGDLLGLLDTSGDPNQKLVRVDFAARKATTIYASKQRYLPYYASALDMVNKMFLYNTVIPHSEPPDHTVITLNFKTKKTQVSPIFTNYSVGGLLLEESTRKLYGFLQTPSTEYDGPKYKALIGDMDTRAGAFKAVSDVWPGKGAYSDVDLTLNPNKRLMYVLLYDKLITLCLKTGETLYVDKKERKGTGLRFAII